MSRWKISTEGTSRTTILSRDEIPVARFYADRFDAGLLEEIEGKLNASAGPSEILKVCPPEIEALQTARAIILEAPELNMSNYDHEQVHALNEAAIEAFLVLDAAITAWNTRISDDG